MSTFTSAEAQAKMPVDQPLLDVISASAEGAWGHMLLNGGYSGDCLRAHDAADKSGSSQEIGFDGNGNLDTSALESFAGSGDAWVEYYDQVTGSLITTATPPKLVSSGTTITNADGDPAAEFTGGQLFQVGTTPTGAVSVLVPGETDAPSTNHMLLSFSNSDSEIRYVDLAGRGLEYGEVDGESNTYFVFEPQGTTSVDVIGVWNDVSTTFRVWTSNTRSKELTQAQTGNEFTDPATFGNRPDGGFPWSGRIPLGVVWQSALSRDDLRQIGYNLGWI